MIERRKALREKYAGNEIANDMMNATEREMEVYKKYSDYYGYVFYKKHYIQYIDNKNKIM